MPTAKELQAQRAPVGAEIRKLADKVQAENRDFNTEERSAWDRVNREFDDLTRKIDEARKADELAEYRAEFRRETAAGRPKPGLEDTKVRTRPKRKGDAEETRALAFQAWCRKQHGLDLAPKHRRACKRLGFNPGRRNLEVRLPRRPGVVDKRALSVVTGSAGAHTVPQGFVANLEKALKAFNGARQVADVIRTDAGNPLPWPTVNDTGNVGEILAENTAVSNLDPPFGVTTFGAYKYSSKQVLVPTELLEDSAFALADELSMMLGERIGRIQEQHFTTGTGSGQPQGVVTGSTLGKTAVSATAITSDDILDLIHSVDPAYRRDPSFRLMMHDQVYAAVRKLKDSQGRFLYEDARDGGPDKVHNVPIVINQNMASAVTTGQKTMLAGAFRKFKVRDVNQVRVRRLEERYADADQVGFLAFLRSDSKVLDAGTRPIKYLAQA